MDEEHSARWIIVPRWDEFQHRDMARSSVPPWIKTYTKLMSDDDFLGLSFHLRGLLISLWLEYAAARRQLSGSTVALSRRLHQRVTVANLEALNHAGFIHFSASKPASNIASTSASLEVEVEKEGFKRPLGATSKQAEFVAKVANDPRGREHRPYDPPRDPATHIERLIANGAIPDRETLDAELAALGLNGATADRLRELIPPSPNDTDGRLAT